MGKFAFDHFRVERRSSGKICIRSFSSGTSLERGNLHSIIFEWNVIRAGKFAFDHFAVPFDGKFWIYSNVRMEKFGFSEERHFRTRTMTSAHYTKCVCNDRTPFPNTTPLKKAPRRESGHHQTTNVHGSFPARKMPLKKAPPPP